jgi:hypothetical protein
VLECEQSFPLREPATPSRSECEGASDARSLSTSLTKAKRAMWVATPRVRILAPVTHDCVGGLRGPAAEPTLPAQPRVEMSRSDHVPP